MAIEPLTGLTYWDDGALQPDLLFNALLQWVATWSQSVVISVEDAPPVSPSNGDTYLIGVGAGVWSGHNDSIAYRYDDGVTSTWLFFPPNDGYRTYLLSTADTLLYDGSGGWSAAPGGLADAPSDGLLYGRKDAAWESIPSGSGDVVGPSSSVDNTIPRYDGITGKLIQGSGVSLTDSDEISGYLGNIRLETGTTYTLDVAGSDTDSGRVIDHANASAITVTLPATAPVGFGVTYIQSGAGQITFSPASGAVLRNRQSHNKTAAQWAGVTLCVRSNAGGSAAEYVLAGDTAA